MRERERERERGGGGCLNAKCRQHQRLPSFRTAVWRRRSTNYIGLTVSSLSGLWRQAASIHLKVCRHPQLQNSTLASLSFTERRGGSGFFLSPPRRESLSGFWSSVVKHKSFYTSPYFSLVTGRRLIGKLKQSPRYPSYSAVSRSFHDVLVQRVKWSTLQK